MYWPYRDRRQNSLLLNLAVLIPGREKINLNFYFHNSLWYLKGFIKALKAFIKSFEAPRSVKIKISVNFHFKATF